MHKQSGDGNAELYQEWHNLQRRVSRRVYVCSSSAPRKEDENSDECIVGNSQYGVTAFLSLL